VGAAAPIRWLVENDRGIGDNVCEAVARDTDDLNALDIFAEEAPDSAERAALGIDVAMVDVVGLADAKLVKLSAFSIAHPADTEACHSGANNTTENWYIWLDAQILAAHERSIFDCYI
jgi:hypothetical protein